MWKKSDWTEKHWIYNLLVFPFFQLKKKLKKNLGERNTQPVGERNSQPVGEGNSQPVVDQQKEHENNTLESMKQICGKLETSLSIYAWGTAPDHALISMRINV